MAVAKQVRAELLSLLKSEDWFTDELAKELPLKWEKHGDLVLVPEKTFLSTSIWLQHIKILEAACKLLRCNRLARRIGPTQNDDFRSPKIQMLFGNSTSVTKKENGILYSWDLSKCMFSSGNITEKQRIGSWDLKGKVVVDMYAGIGYFTLTYLIHSKCELVYACEWNPASVEALQNNFKLNKISPDRYVLLPGDNRKTCPKGVADHVNLGLIPSSEDGWPAACAALKKDSGGMLHVHGNVDSKPGETENNEGEPSSIDASTTKWGSHVTKRIQNIFCDLYPNEEWKVSVENMVKVKSYAPHVDHVVADILCCPSL
ncbi:tRNA wybutosine-synthesizing protein 2 [Orchesella cincta]|uniref:tRNA(Phe) (4-demethylwyosine(37)-C(7)) aminocarboxypropyltransferase n=1 Tax=Orchesella cincta TaxID=48709 RepID=A0A1D2NEG1_ORCCI|nr:tRNA wybutosine-synthesizing protein 2 [Orchesella cincta]